MNHSNLSESNNIYNECPALMSDGKIHQVKQKDDDYHENLLSNETSGNSYKYREYLQASGQNYAKVPVSADNTNNVNDFGSSNINLFQGTCKLIGHGEPNISSEININDLSGNLSWSIGEFWEMKN